MRGPPRREDLWPSSQRATPRRARTPMGQCRVHTHRPVPTAQEQRTPTTRFKPGQQPGEDERLTSTPLTTVRSTPPGDVLPPAPQREQPQERRLRNRCRAPTPTPPTPGEHGQQGLAAGPKDGRPGVGGRLKPDAPRNGEKPPPGRAPAIPGARGARSPRAHDSPWGCPAYVQGTPTGPKEQPPGTPAMFGTSQQKCLLRKRRQALPPAPHHAHSMGRKTSRYGHSKATGGACPVPSLRHSDTTIAEPRAPRKTRPRCLTLDAAHEVIRALGFKSRSRDPPPQKRTRTPTPTWS